MRKNIRNIATLHMVFGVLCFLVFLGTGVYLKIGFPDLYNGDQGIRALFRANHIYILLGSLVHLCFGRIKREIFKTRKERVVQRLFSVFLFIGQFSLIYAFFKEPITGSLERTYTFWGIILIVIGVLGDLFLVSVKKLAKDKLGQ